MTKYPAKCKKYISVSASGKIILKKGIKKGNYKVTVTATQTIIYKKAMKVVTVKIK